MVFVLLVMTIHRSYAQIRINNQENFAEAGKKEKPPGLNPAAAGNELRLVQALIE
jgi:hypothetical protein